LHEILPPGSGQNRAKLQKDIEEYHIAYGIDFDDTDIDTFIAWSSALSPEAHAEWGLYKILEHMGLHEILPPGAGQNRAQLQKDIEEYHIAYGIDFDDTDIDTFIARIPDDLAFDKGKKSCVFLEYTRAMDTNEDWAEKKEQEKNDRYSSHLGFINHLSNREKSGWKASQTNFTTGVRGYIQTD